MCGGHWGHCCNPLWLNNVAWGWIILYKFRGLWCGEYLDAFISWANGGMNPQTPRLELDYSHADVGGDTAKPQSLLLFKAPNPPSLYLQGCPLLRNQNLNCVGLLWSLFFMDLSYNWEVYGKASSWEWTPERHPVFKWDWTMYSTQHSRINTQGPQMWSLKIKSRRIFTLTSYDFSISTSILMKLELTIVTICNSYLDEAIPKRLQQP